MDDKSFFREQAVKFKQVKLKGDIVLIQPLPLRVTAKLLVFIVLVVIVFISTVKLPRTETVRGFLEPAKGIVQVYGESGGVIMQLLVREGQYISAGQELALIGSQQIQTSFGESDVLTQIGELKSQILDNSTLMANKRKISEIEKSTTLKSIQHYSGLLSHLESERLVLAERAFIAQQQIDMLGTLLSGKHISESYFYERKSASLEVIQEHLNMQKQKFDIDRYIEQLQGTLERLEFELDNAIAEIEISNSNLTMKISSLERKRQYTIKSPTSGYITNIQFQHGESIKSGISIMTILPKDSLIVGKVLVPSNKIGSLDIGQSAKIFYDAYPYQGFGFHSGEIVSISSVAYSDESLNLPIRNGGVNYVATIKLEKQTIEAFGKSNRLSPGMLFSADIVIGKDSILNWALEPIYSIKNKM